MKKEEELHFQGGVGMTAQKNKKLSLIPIAGIVTAITTGKFLGLSFMETIEKIRAAVYKSDIVQKFKAQLPFILSSVFVLDDELAKGPTLHLGTVSLDFDFGHLFNRDERMTMAMDSKTKLAGDPYVLLAFFSPQFGLKLICKIPPDLMGHDRRLKALAKYFRAKYGLDHDPSCNGTKRLLFLSYDPAPIFNPHCLVFEEIDIEESRPRNEPQNIESSTPGPVAKKQDILPAETAALKPEPENLLTEELRLDIEFCIADIKERAIDITAIETEWQRIGLAFATLQEAGRKYFHAVSEHFARYTEAETDRKFDYCLKYANGSVRINTFFYYCKAHGVRFRMKPKQVDFLQAAGSGSSNESSILTETPTFDQSIYELLPTPLKNLCARFDHVRSRDMLLCSMLAVTGAILHKMVGRYDGKKMHPVCFFFIVAPPASNKSVVLWGKHLGSLVEGYLSGIWKSQAEEHTAGGGKDKDKPTPLMFYIPANSTATGLIQLLAAQETGVIFLTEADTMTSMLSSEHGKYLHHLRDIFDHVEIKEYRKTDKTYVTIDHPVLSILLCGTPDQLHRLIKDGGSGAHSRFGFYGFASAPIYFSPFSEKSFDLEDHFDLGAKEIFELYNYLRDKQEIRFSLSKEQIKIFDRVVESWQTQSYKSHGDIGSSISTRLGVIMYRVAMTLTGLRTKCRDAEVVCSDVDFDIAIKMGETFRVHSLSVLATFPEPVAQVTTEVKTIERFLQSLPQRISSKDAVALHKEFGVSERTIQRYLKKLREAGKIVLDGDGMYTKRA